MGQRLCTCADDRDIHQSNRLCGPAEPGARGLLHLRGPPALQGRTRTPSPAWRSAARSRSAGRCWNPPSRWQRHDLRLLPMGRRFPSTKARMQRYEAAAPALAEAALDALGLDEEAPRVTHLIFASCTGFAAPGLDHWVINRYGIRGSVERSVVGFMGCQAAINALKLAWHIVRSEPAGARAGRLPGTLHAASARHLGDRAIAVLPDLRRWLRRRAGHRRPDRAADGRLPRRASCRRRPTRSPGASATTAST